MYDEQLERLIELALADGHISDQERQVLLKRARSLGIDLDEFNMVLDGLLLQRQQAGTGFSAPAVPPAAASSQQGQEKLGHVRKCPGCGAIASSFSTACQDCGIEFSGIAASITIRSLFDALSALDRQHGSLPEETIAIKKATVIKHFPIPNARDELLELLYYIQPKISGKGISDPNYNDWAVKFSEVLSRSRSAFATDDVRLKEIAAIEAAAKLTRADHSKIVLQATGGVLARIASASVPFFKWAFATKFRGFVTFYVLFTLLSFAILPFLNLKGAD